MTRRGLGPVLVTAGMVLAWCIYYAVSFFVVGALAIWIASRRKRD